jgi:eukaryotic-like serine/threonine-protein kinase
MAKTGRGRATAHTIPGDLSMSRVEADRNLLFGILALQMDFVTRDALVAAMNAWVLAKHRPLGEILMEHGALGVSRHALLAPLVEEHVRQHGDPAQSLAALSSGGGAVDALRSIGDEVLEASLASFAASLKRYDDPLAYHFSGPPEGATTVTFEATRAGDRFRILRPHARGGLGTVTVALDTELNREVALKQIQERFADHAESRARFVLEAEVTGGLEHPGIVPVYSLGHYGDGRPFYAMRFIKGDSLKQAINRFHRDDFVNHDPGVATLGFQKLLRRFLDVCNAISYAHSRGVLHRDLKPGNIMVGQYGETLVVDWGLAKVVGAEDGSGEATLRPPSASGSNETLAGSAIGTPQFMSPEQAAGEIDRLGPASDVYSLGATMYYLLTGKAPFQGEDAGDILARVRRGEFPPPRLLNPKAPRSLEAVCLKAMATDATARYPTPQALAEDVERWLADEPVSAWREPIAIRGRRWVRRHRPLVTAGAVGIAMALFGLAAVAAVQARANRQLSLANTRVQERFDLALGAIKDYRAKIGDDPRMSQPEFRDLRDKLLGTALRFHTELGALLEKDGNSSRPNQTAVASAYAELARLTFDIGKSGDSVAAYERAVTIGERLIHDRKEDREATFSLAVWHNELGNAQRRLGRLAEALAAYGRSKALCVDLVRAEPANPKYANAFAGAASNIATVKRETGRFGEAAESAREALTILEREARAHPTSSEAVYSLAKSYFNAAEFEEQAGRVREAHDLLVKAVTTCERLARSGPPAAARLFHGNALIKLGIRSKALSRWDESEARLHEGLDVLTALHKDEPAVTAHQSRLGNARHALGVFFQEKGRRADAMASYRGALELRERVARENPEVPVYRSELAETVFMLGTLQNEAGSRDEGNESFETARGLLAKLSRDAPENPAYQEFLAKCLNNIGNGHRTKGDLTAAIATHRQALATRRDLARRHPNVPAYRFSVTGSLQLLAQVYNNAGRTAEAESALDEAREIRESLVRDHPGVVEFRRGLATTIHQAAYVHLEAGRLDKARPLSLRALEIRRALAVAEPEVTLSQSDFVASLNNYGNLLKDSGETAGALAALKEAAAVAEHLATRQPENVNLRTLLGASQRNVGDVLSRSPDRADALEWFNRSIGTLSAVLKVAPARADARRFLRNGLESRAALLGRLNRHSEAVDDWDRLLSICDERDRNRFRLARALGLVRSGRLEPALIEADDILGSKGISSDFIYGAACVYSHASKVGGLSSKVYADRALTLLGLLADAGYFRQPELLALIRNDPDLDPLRESPGFQSLIRSLPDRGFPANPFAAERRPAA